jgi:glycosyltransferase involved in cell wall biosynthesis
VILNAIDLDKFSPSQASQIASNGVRDELGLNRGEFVLGIVGQLTPRKGQLELIEAFAQADLSRATLLIVGAPLFNRDADYAEQLEQEAESRGVARRVRLLGARSDVSAIMHALDLLVVNSTAEPFGLVILEAMACGTPVLATAVDGIPEIVEHGRSGWLVPPGQRDSRLLADAITRLSRDPELRTRLAEQGRERVTAKFSLDRYLSELESFYEALEKARGHNSGTVTQTISLRTGVVRVDTPQTNGLRYINRQT